MHIKGCIFTPSGDFQGAHEWLHSCLTFIRDSQSQKLHPQFLAHQIGAFGARSEQQVLRTQLRKTDPAVSISTSLPHSNKLFCFVNL